MRVSRWSTLVDTGLLTTQMRTWCLLTALPMLRGLNWLGFEIGSWRRETIAGVYKSDPEAELLQSRRAGPAIVQEAVDKGVDAIVLGIPYTEQFGDFSLGETVPYVLKNAPCRVILWREPMPWTLANNGVRSRARGG